MSSSRRHEFSTLHGVLSDSSLSRHRERSTSPCTCHGIYADRDLEIKGFRSVPVEKHTCVSSLFLSTSGATGTTPHNLYTKGDPGHFLGVTADNGPTESHGGGREAHPVTRWLEMNGLHPKLSLPVHGLQPPLHRPEAGGAPWVISTQPASTPLARD